MKFVRNSFQRGSLRQVSRANGKGAWEFRFRDPATRKQKSMYLDMGDYPAKAAAERYFQTFVCALNSGHPRSKIEPPQVGVLLDRFIREEGLIEIKQRRPGEISEDREQLSYATAVSYLSVIRKIREQWGEVPITKVKPVLVKDWLKSMDVAPKTKGNIKGLMHRLFELAMLWEVIDVDRNPMDLVEIKGISKRTKKPTVLTVDQFYMILDMLPEPYRTMVLVAQCLGLRVEEVLALDWEDIDLENRSILVVRAVVHGRIQRVKTEYSEDELPLDPDFAAVLAGLKQSSRGSGLVFPSPVTGGCYHASPIQQDYIRPAGRCLVRCPQCSAEPGCFCRDEAGKRVSVHPERVEESTRKKLGNVGWHTFRHTYRSWLDETGAPVGVQQKLMRHADIATTMNQYGNALMEAKRKANSKVVKMALRCA